jgi:hypothetical protein
MGTIKVCHIKSMWLVKKLVAHVYFQILYSRMKRKGTDVGPYNLTGHIQVQVQELG